jgi:RNA-directed DNA polymerase
VYSSIWRSDGRLISPDSHEGSRRESLVRHQRECKLVSQASKRDRDGFTERLAPRIAASGNLRLAIDHVANGGPCPGPDGFVLADLCEDERFELARVLGQAIRAGTYWPGPTRKVKIPKGPGRGSRTITMLNAQDRVVQRATVQVAQPFLDARFSPNSLGSRPGKSRDRALVRIEELTQKHGLQVVVSADIRDAFDQVPRGRLLDVLKMHIPAQSFMHLAEQVIGRDRQRGIPQGGPLSPLLLNVYLDHVLDKPWTKRHPDMPLLRVVDDLLVLAEDRTQAEQAHDSLVSLLTPAGMPLKGTADEAIKDLAQGETVLWLGYRLRRGADGLEAHLPEEGRAWHSLANALVQAHEHLDAPLRARQVILGWIRQQGPCFAHADHQRVYSQIASISRALSFTEIPSSQKFVTAWRRAHKRWLDLRSRFLDLEEDC